MPTSESWGYQKRKSKKLKTYLKEKNEGKLPQSGERNRRVSPESSENTNKLESKRNIPTPKSWGCQ